MMITLEIVLIYTFYKTTLKAKDLWMKETEKKALALEALIERRERKKQLKRSRTALSISRVGDRPISKQLEGIAYEEANHFTSKRVKTISTTFLVLFCALFLMSTDLVKDDPDTNLMIKLAAFLMFVGYCIHATIMNSRMVTEIHKIKRRENYDFDEADIRFDKRKILFLVISCFFAGMLSGILGIAGGTIMSPLFLSLGMLPPVVAATN